MSRYILLSSLEFCIEKVILSVIRLTEREWNFKCKRVVDYVNNQCIPIDTPYHIIVSLYVLALSSVLFLA